MKRLKVLISAHEFSPVQGSECAVGWNTVKFLSEYHDLTVIYAETNQFETANYDQAVRKFYRENGENHNLKLHPVPQPKLTKILAKINLALSPPNSAIGFAPLFYIGYNFWQKKVFRIAKRLNYLEEFDIVHHLTSISFREPGYLWKLNIPFVWGPCSGLVKMPSTFYKNLKKKEIVFEILRRISNSLQSMLSYSVHKATLKASIIYPVTIDDFNFFRKRCSHNVRQMLDVGTFTDSKIDQNVLIVDPGRLKVIWVGRLVYSKALDILLYALSIDFKMNKEFDVIIVGDGPLMNYYKNLAKKLNIENLIWTGNIKHKEVFKLMKQSDILVHTSIKEATSSVILEALSFGLPVICHDAFGMGIAINESCGIKIPLLSPLTSKFGFYEGLKSLVYNSELLKKFKAGAHKRAHETSWAMKAKTIAEDYMEIPEIISH